MNQTGLRAIVSALLLLFVLPTVATAHPGWGLVVDRQGTIYFTDLERVWKIAPDGRVTIFVEAVHTHALYLDETDALYGEHQWYEEATDAFHRRYWKATPDGRVSDLSAEEAARFFDRWDAAGNRYHVFNDRQQALITKTTPDGTVFFADIDQRKVFKVTPDGTLSTVLASGPLWIPSGLTLVGRDVYILESRTPLSKPLEHFHQSGPRVRKLAPDGTVTLVGIADP